MWLKTSCDLTFNISSPTTFVLMLRPRSGANQWISFEKYKIIPSVPVMEFTDIYGNLCQRLVAPVGTFAIYTSAEVMTTNFVDQAPTAPFVEIENLPENVLIYLLPSRYCESDRFNDMATKITAGVLLGYDQVSAITHWIQQNIRFEPNYSNVQGSAVDVNNRQSGVCRDLAHLAIALCRSISIPARMVVGYLHGLETMDLHAWFEAYVGNRWYTFDATQIEMCGGYVALGYGRDATDVAIYNQFGSTLYPTSQHVSVIQINDISSSLLG